MRSSLHSDRLDLSDAPGCFWLFGAFFCILGGLAMAAAFAARGSLSWQLFFGLLMGVVGVAAGIYVIYEAPSSRVRIRFADRTLAISRRGLLRRQDETYDLGAIQAVYLVQGKDIDGDPVFTLRMQLADGREIPLTLLWLHGRERLEAVLELLSRQIPRAETRVEDG